MPPRYEYRSQEVYGVVPPNEYIRTERPRNVVMMQYGGGEHIAKTVGDVLRDIHAAIYDQGESKSNFHAQAKLTGVYTFPYPDPKVIHQNYLPVIQYDENGRCVSAALPAVQTWPNGETIPSFVMVDVSESVFAKHVLKAHAEAERAKNQQQNEGAAGEQSVAGEA